MRRIRGFLLKHRVTTIFRCIFRRRRSPAGYFRQEPHGSNRVTPVSRFLSWMCSLKKAALCCKNSTFWQGPGRGYMRVGQDPVQEKREPVPKGYMAVYVGRKDGEFHRILVPVVYCNHPLFGKLLQEAENEYGFDHPGGLTIPCRITEFERLQTRIKAGQCARKKSWWKRSDSSWLG